MNLFFDQSSLSGDYVLYVTATHDTVSWTAYKKNEKLVQGLTKLYKIYTLPNLGP